MIHAEQLVQNSMPSSMILQDRFKQDKLRKTLLSLHSTLILVVISLLKSTLILLPLPIKLPKTLTRLILITSQLLTSQMLHPLVTASPDLSSKLLLDNFSHSKISMIVLLSQQT